MPKQWYSFKNEEDSDEAELAIYDEISAWWGTGAKSFRDQLKACDGKKLTICINSPGGSVFEGYTILNMLLNRKGENVVRVDGMAASIASVIAMAADEGKLYMPLNSALFVHLPWTVAIGNEDDLEKIGSDLKKIKEGIISAYERHATISREELEDAMREETLYTAEEAAEVFGAIVQPLTRIAAKFDKEMLPEKAMAFYKNAKKNSKSEGTNSSDGKNQNQKDKAMSEELKNKVASLEAENKKLVADKQAELDNTKNSAKTEAEDAEKTRREGIKDLLDKYNVDGALDKIGLEALVDGTSVDAFKDQVLEHVSNEGGTKPAAKPGSGEEQNAKKTDPDGDTIEGLEEKAKKTTDSIERGRIGNKIRALRKKEREGK